MYVVTFTKKQDVTWFRNGIDDGESTFYPEQQIFVDILCKEENMPKHQRDPIYIYTVRNQRGQTGVICEYLDQPLRIRSMNDDTQAA